MVSECGPRAAEIDTNLNSAIFQIKLIFQNHSFILLTGYKKNNKVKFNNNIYI